MRCYFMRNGHIVDVESLPGLSDEQAIERGHEMFAVRKNERFDGFEVWDMARVVIQYPPPEIAPDTQIPNASK
jgi:hypothetical protein